MAHVLDLTHIMLWVIEKQTKMYKQISGNNMVLVNLIYSSYVRTTNIQVTKKKLQIFEFTKCLCHIQNDVIFLSIRQYFLFFFEKKTVFSWYLWTKKALSSPNVLARTLSLTFTLLFAWVTHPPSVGSRLY